MGKTQFKEIIERVKEVIPKEKWEEEIKARIKAAMPEPEHPEPENLDIDDFTRAIADKICASNSGAKNNKTLLVQFARGKEKIAGVDICLKTQEIKPRIDRGKILGALVSFKHDDKVFVGWSMYNKNHEVLPFSRKEAVRVAVLRGMSDGLKVNTVATSLKNKWFTESGVQIPEQISKDMAKFLERTRNYFSLKDIENITYIFHKKELLKDESKR
jgi:hypothetical protein